MSLNILIIGATSGIAQAVARQYAIQQANFFLVARNAEKLNIVSADLLTCGAKTVKTFVLDTNDVDLLSTMFQQAWIELKQIDIALIAQGTLSDQKRAEKEIAYNIAEFRNNAESVIICLTLLASYFETQGQGVIVVLSSVAGDRGRASNYLYAAAKAAINTYASGLRMRLFSKGIHVLTIKPGFVATAMTLHLNLPRALTASPERVAKDITKAIKKRRNEIYTPSFWRYIMLTIKLLPTVIFKRLNM